MDIVVNDKSLCGQFTEENFLIYMQNEMLKIVKMLQEYDCVLYKDYNTYDCMVTPTMKFVDFLKIQGEPIIDILRITLVQLSSDIPYWNDSIKTKGDREYITLIKEVPNCITEAYEREGMVLSFLHNDFEKVYLELQCDKKNFLVPNIFNYKILQTHFDKLGILDIWKENSFYINELGYKFEVRFREENHNRAHFHVSNSNYSASLSIPDIDVLAGHLIKEDERKIVAWAMRNMKNIVELWNRYHPDKLVEYTD